MADRLDEQLHASCGCLISNILPEYTLGRGIQVVSG